MNPFASLIDQIPRASPVRMKKSARELTVAERLEVARQIIDGAGTARHMARELGVSESTIYAWRDQVRANGANERAVTAAPRRTADELRPLIEQAMALRTSGLTVRQVARRVGLHESTVYRLYRGG